MSGPKPGDPDFVPRHPVIDLELAAQRVREREAYTRTMPPGSLKMTVDADTEIMASLVLEVRNLRAARDVLRQMVSDAYKGLPPRDTP
jgi:hypothetical protein